jgi:hypothetical protein
MSDGLLSAAILARRRRPVASRIALDPLRRSMCLVMYRRTDRASEMADKYGTFLSFFFLHSTPPSVRGDTEQILARWRRPVALSEALDPLYRSVSALSCRRMNPSVETGRTEVHSFVVDESGINLNAAN